MRNFEVRTREKILEMYDHEASVELGRRVFVIGPNQIGTTTDAAKVLIYGGRVSTEGSPESIAADVNSFLNGHGYPLRTYRGRACSVNHTSQKQARSTVGVAEAVELGR